MSDARLRILTLLSYLVEYSDEDHVLSTPDILAYLHDKGIEASRKTLRDDIALLKMAGFEIMEAKAGRCKSYYYSDRIFEVPELRILADAISSARFITASKSSDLIRKLGLLAAYHQRDKVVARIFIADRLKASNVKGMLIIDNINLAMDMHKKIQFKYFDYSPTKEIVFAHGGEIYTASPYALIWNDDRYYMPAYCEKHKDIIAFRVDRMTVPIITDIDARRDEGFNPVEFYKKMIQMFSGKERLVTIRCENPLMKYVIDRYGEDIETELDGDEHFLAKIPIHTSRTFYGWVFQFDGGIEVEGPLVVRDEYKAMLRRASGGK
ncbi:MAG: WYL domain-containing protein [Lachnospiraceae bacterium]|nr:WYL domain-containing protein [Lachnospiraceae bacterium]